MSQETMSAKGGFASGEKKFNQDYKVQLLLGLFVAMLILSNLLGSKVTTFLGVGVSVGIFVFPLTFLITDIVAEVKGKSIASRFIVIGMISILISLIYTAISVSLEPNPRYEFNSEYTTIFSGALRISAASLIAFMFSQLNDVFLYHKLKEKTKGKLLWLRNNISTMVSQLIDTLLFMFIAFYGISEQFDVWFILELSLPYYLFKLLFAVIDTPFVYLGVKWLRDEPKQIKSERSQAL